MAENLVPIAISSELDVSGNERIHVATRATLSRPTYVATSYFYYAVTNTPFSELESVGKVNATTGEVTSFSFPIIATSSGMDMCMSSDGVYVAAGYRTLDTTTYQVEVFKRTGESFVSLGVLTQPALSHGNSTIGDMAWSSDGTYLAVPRAGNSGASTTLVVYKRTGDTFSSPIDLALPTTADIVSARWSPDSNYLVACRNSSTTKIYVFKRTADTFTQITPITQPTSNVLVTAAFSAGSNHLVVGSANPTILNLYTIAADVFTSAGTISTSGGFGGGSFPVFTDDGTRMYLPYLSGNINQWSISGNTYTPIATTTTGVGRYAALSPDNRHLVGANISTQTLRVWERTGDTLTLVGTNTEINSPGQVTIGAS